MEIDLQAATPDDVPELVALRLAVDDNLTAQYGRGFWSARPTEKGAALAMKQGTVFIARDNGRLIASLTLSARKPWAIDPAYFTRSKSPLYLTSMAVAPDLQRAGLGRLCIDEVRRIAREWPADSCRLDAYDADAGAGG